MKDQPKQQPQAKSEYFNLIVEGVGYLNRVRTVKPKNGDEFLACTVSAMRGSVASVDYTYFDCRVSGADAKRAVKLLQDDVNDQKPVLIGFKISDIYPEAFTFEKGERAGQQGLSVKGRLLRVKFAKVNGEAVGLPESEQESATEAAAA